MALGKNIDDYEDSNVFKPGERWQSPRGSHYYVLGNQVGGLATLRTLPGPWSSPVPISTEALGKLRMVPWDGVMNWVRYATAEQSHPSPTSGKDIDG